jgi:hypothetical protein
MPKSELTDEEHAALGRVKGARSQPSSAVAAARSPEGDPGKARPERNGEIVPDGGHSRDCQRVTRFDPEPTSGTGSNRRLLESAGFAIAKERSRREFAREFFRQMRAQAAESGGPPPLGLHILMGSSAPQKVANVVSNLERGLILRRPRSSLGRFKVNADPEIAAAGHG